MFNSDAQAALGRRDRNPVWRELMRRAGGPTLRLNDRILSVILRSAAWTKSVNDEAFTGLEARGRRQGYLAAAVQLKFRPPLTLIICPVTKAASSLVR